MKSYWYKYTVISCPMCGKFRVIKCREYSIKPREYNKRHLSIDVWDNCGIL